MAYKTLVLDSIVAKRCTGTRVTAFSWAKYVLKTKGSVMIGQGKDYPHANDLSHLQSSGQAASGAAAGKRDPSRLRKSTRAQVGARGDCAVGRLTGSRERGLCAGQCWGCTAEITSFLTPANLRRVLGAAGTGQEGWALFPGPLAPAPSLLSKFFLNIPLHGPGSCHRVSFLDRVH